LNPQELEKNAALAKVSPSEFGRNISRVFRGERKGLYGFKLLE
jgi:hypothetical protein